MKHSYFCSFPGIKDGVLET